MVEFRFFGSEACSLTTTHKIGNLRGEAFRLQFRHAAGADRDL
jgi:hypothetical protein